jgi:hypothetical protein
VVLFKMALLGYLYGITSERRLAEELRLNLAFRWLVGYDLDERTPDHSVLSKARARFGVTVYQAFFAEVVPQCEQAGLVRGDTLYLDSTLMRADAALTSLGSRVLTARVAAPGLANTSRRSGRATRTMGRQQSRLCLPCPRSSSPSRANCWSWRDRA